MALLDISQVTRALINLIETHVQASPIWPGGQVLSIVPDPPDNLSGDNTLGLYLYHIEEDPNNKNMLPEGNSTPPIRYTPMPLLLYYQLSAHSDLATPTGSYREQLMLGAAAKALHDYPVINENTEVNNVQVFPAVLVGGENRFQIELRPVSSDEAVNFWTAGSSPLRLACYYRLSVVMLEPEEQDSGSGQVLKYNVFAFPQTRPYITATSNRLVFTIPGETSSRSVTLTPAQLAVGDVLTVEGVNFVSEDTRLELNYPEWEDGLMIDPLAWAQQASAEKMTVIIQPDIDDQDLVPGIYYISVRTVKTITGTEGDNYDTVNNSNISPITITPRVDSIGIPNVNGVFNVTGHLFEHTLIAEGSVSAFISDIRLQEGTANALNFGEFDVVDANTLQIRLPDTLASASIVPIRIQVNKAESAPNWLTVP